MTPVSPARTRFALLALALGGFGIGATEFVAMGLLPQIAADLPPQVYAVSPADAIAQSGAMISAYALGVVVGAPTIATFAARLPRRALLVAFAIAFTLGTVASALAPTFPALVVARFLAGVPHGAYFGVAALVAAELLGPGKRGRGAAFVLVGLTLANVVGVPLITLLGQHAGWRSAYLVVAAIFALTIVALRFALPFQPGDPAATARRELGAFARPAVWLALLTGALGFGGFFAVYSYIAPLTTEYTGLPAWCIPVALVVMGIGMTVGNLVGGWAAYRGVIRAIFVSFGAFAVALLGLALTAGTPAGLFGFLFLVGATSAALSPIIQTRLMEVAGDSQTLAAAVNHSALNIGNSIGALFGGIAIAAGLGYLAPTWIGLALCVPGILVAGAGALITTRLERRSGRVLDQDPVLDRALP